MGGTGMRASVHVDLPGFPTKQACKAYVKTTPHYVDVRGTRGEATSTEGVRRYDISNKARLGSNCVEQITTMVNGVKALLEYKPPADDFVAASKLALEVVMAQPQFAYYKYDKTGEKESLLKTYRVLDQLRCNSIVIIIYDNTYDMYLTHFS